MYRIYILYLYTCQEDKAKCKYDNFGAPGRHVFVTPDEPIILEISSLSSL